MIIKLAVRILAISILWLQSGCGSISNHGCNLLKNYKEILALELKLQTQKDDNDNFLLNKYFFESEEFVQFLQSKIYVDSVKFIRPHQFFTLHDAQSLFKQPDGDFLMEQLEKPSFSLKKITPREYKGRLVNLEKLKKEIGSDGVKSIEFYTTRHLYLSCPVISKD